MTLYYEFYSVQTIHLQLILAHSCSSVMHHSLDRVHWLHFHCGEANVDGSDLQLFSLHLARTIILSNLTLFFRGSECLVCRQPWGISTDVLDRLPLSMWWLDDLSQTTFKFLVLWILFNDVSIGLIHDRFLK